MSRQQYGARKAVAGMMKGERLANEACAEAIQRMDNCNTVAELREALAWVKTQNLYLRTEDWEQKLRASFDRACERCNPKGVH
jgi:hypothetical protein